MGGLFAAMLYTTSTKMAKRRHGVTQKAGGINTIPVKHQSASAAAWEVPLPQPHALRSHLSVPHPVRLRVRNLRQVALRSRRRALAQGHEWRKGRGNVKDLLHFFARLLAQGVRKLEREQEETLIDAHGVGLLVDATTPDGATPLYFACKNGFVECARILLQYGATPARGTHAVARGYASYG